MKVYGYLAAGLGLALLAGCLPMSSTQPTGRDLYMANCAACHGRNANGDGPVIEGLDIAPPDLTGIAARNGGTFPMAQVMSTIDGYHRAEEFKSYMPEFGTMLEGPTVLFDSGDGRLTPTPAALVALATYLESIQD